jgi:hypothetical protein
MICRYCGEDIKKTEWSGRPYAHSGGPGWYSCNSNRTEFLKVDPIESLGALVASPLTEEEVVDKVMNKYYEV